MRDALRGRVIDTWKNRGRLDWGRDETVRSTILADEGLEREGKNPAPTFRQKRLQGDGYYMRVWVAGCRFPWLRPQQPLGGGPESSRARPSVGVVTIKEQDASVADVLAQLEALDVPVYVTQRGRPKAVVMHYADYQALLEKLDDLGDALAMKEALSRPQEEAVSLQEYERQRTAQISR